MHFERREISNINVPSEIKNKEKNYKKQSAIKMNEVHLFFFYIITFDRLNFRNRTVLYKYKFKVQSEINKLQQDLTFYMYLQREL